MAIVAVTAPYDCFSLVESPAGAQVDSAHQRTVTDSVQKVVLARLERDEAAQYVEHIHQLRRVLGEPAIGLDIAER